MLYAFLEISTTLLSEEPSASAARSCSGIIESMVHSTSSSDATLFFMSFFLSCTYIDASRTADYQTTTGLNNIINNKGNADDIYAFLADHNIPADEVTLYQLAEEIIKNPPRIGYLTISNALQWRLQYKRIVSLEENIPGITRIVSYDGK